MHTHTHTHTQSYAQRHTHRTGWRAKHLWMLLYRVQARCFDRATITQARSNRPLQLLPLLQTSTPEQSNHSGRTAKCVSSSLPVQDTALCMHAAMRRAVPPTALWGRLPLLPLRRTQRPRPSRCMILRRRPRHVKNTNQRPVPTSIKCIGHTVIYIINLESMKCRATANN